MKIQVLQSGNFYHIYNRGNNSQDIFFENENYHHFLRLYDKYIYPIAETYAWCLMKNHFHLLVYIKEPYEIDEKQLHYSTIKKPTKIDHSLQFSHFFNAYTQAINKRYTRTGSLFEKPFKRKLVSDQKYFNKLIFYIHNNPVHHGFIEHVNDYPWSSYDEIINNNSKLIKQNEVIKHFDSVSNFKYLHQIEMNNYQNEILDFY